MDCGKCVMGTFVGGVIEARSSEVCRLVPVAKQQLRRKQGKWKYGGDIQWELLDKGVETMTWELHP